MGLFDGIENAEIFERGKFLPPGFAGVLEVKRTLSKDSLKSGVGFIVEFAVAQVDRPGQPDHELSPVVLGEKRTWWQGMTDQTVAFPACLEFMAALSGYQRHEKDAIEAGVKPHVRETLNHAVKNPDENDLIGCQVRLETSHKITKKGSDFTVHTWSPHEDPGTGEVGAAIGG